MIHKKRENLYLFDLDQNRTGFRKFIASWLFQSDDQNILVDPGPLSSIQVLQEGLSSIGIKNLDYILLTHIHIDHAGGTGKLLEQFPDTPVICHPRGIPHLINPEKLWEGTKKVLGPMAGIYGAICPVPEKNLTYSDIIPLSNKHVDVFETPGHASHHISFKVDDLLFAGEALGVSFPESSGTYLRLATPPVFIYEIYKKSIQFIQTLDDCTVCFGHYDMKSNSRSIAKTALEQLDIWMEIAEKYQSRGYLNNLEEIFHTLLTLDPNLKMFDKLSPDIQQREKEFILNSLAGIKGYLGNKQQ